MSRLRFHGAQINDSRMRRRQVGAVRVTAIACWKTGPVVFNVLATIRFRVIDLPQLRMA